MTELTLNRRFEFSAAHRYLQPEWSKEKNMEVFGSKFKGEFGHGHNYQIFFVFSGEINPRDGMLVNFYDIKSQIREQIKEKYDHKFLNEDISAFKTIVPTPENLAKLLLQDANAWFESTRAKPISCHLIESENIEATAYAKGDIERHIWETFNIPFAHPEDKTIRILSPIKMRITLGGKPDKQTGRLKDIEKFQEEFKKFQLSLNPATPLMPADPTTSVPFDFLKYCFSYFRDRNIDINRIKIQELDGSFLEYHKTDSMQEGVSASFYAAHRLENKDLSAQENKDLFGKCHNLHGHQYNVEVTVAAKKQRNPELRNAIQKILNQWNYKSLDLETNDFKNIISTTEQMSLTLFSKLQTALGGVVERVRINETANNRVTVRRKNCQQLSQLDKSLNG